MAVIFCIVFFIMSQVTATTTTPLVRALVSVLIKPVTVTMSSHTHGARVALSQHDVVLSQPLIPRELIRGVVSLATMLQQ